MDAIFKALADRQRRDLLDRLFAEDGLTLNALCEGAGISRQAVTKHLAVLEDAGLVVTEKQGREKRHFLNPVPLQEISDRWIAKYHRERLGALTALKGALEDRHEPS